MKELVKANLRSVTQSCKGGVLIDHLERDYISMIGSPIPLKNMGYRTLREMIEDMPDVLYITTNQFGKLVIMAVADESTEHIAKMVSRQKVAKSKVARGRSYRLPTRGGSFGHRPMGNVRTFPIEQRAYHPLPSTSRKPIRPTPKYTAKSFPAEIPPRFRNLKTGVVDNRLDRPVPVSSTSHLVITAPVASRQAIVASPVVAIPSPIIPIISPIPRVASPQLAPNYGAEIRAKIPSPKQPKPKRTVTIPPASSEISGKEFIRRYAQMHELEPVYKTKTMGQKKKTYISTLILDGESYRTFPNDKPTYEEAEELVSVIAKQQIEKKAAEAQYEDSPINSLEDIIKVVARIKDIVSEKPHGVWSSFCYSEYRLKFKENLPDSWLTLVKNHLAGVIDVEVPEGINQPKESCILIVSKTSGNTTPTSTSSRKSNPLEELETNESPLLPEVQNLTLQSDECYGVIVTSVTTTSCIAVRLADSNEAFMKLHERMNEFYQNYNVPVHSVTKVFYIVRTEDGFWNRVRVESFDSETKMATCYFVDIGETTSINISDIRELDPAFEDFPFQAIILNLAGLEDYVELVKLHNLAEALLNKALIAKIISSEENCVSAILYDTSKEIDIDMNEYLKESTLRTCLNFSMPEVGGTAVSYLTNVTPNGDIFLRVRQASIGLLEYELDKFTHIYEKEIGKSHAVSAGKIYVSKYSDGIWYRAVVVSISEVEPNEVELFFVDYGNSNWVSSDSICELEPISRMLAEIPFQAIQCRLNDVPPSSALQWSEEVTKKLYELVPDNEEIIVKVNSSATDNSPPVVSLYTRNQDEALISINDTLAYNERLFKKGGSTSEVSKGADPSSKPSSLAINKDPSSLSRYIPDVAVQAAEIEGHMAKQLSNPSQYLWTPTPDATGVGAFGSDDKNLPQPAVLPEVNEFFEVFIPWVASPSNFVVQPLKSSKELLTLQNDMLKFYSQEENICEMHLVLLKEEGVCAAQHTDKVWYRARVKQIKQDDPVVVAVHFVDFGDYSSVEMSHLQPLYSEFMTLPCQAIKASLYGVKPCAATWGNEECFVFREMIEEKRLVSHVMKKIPNNELDFGNCSLQLALIDTSESDKDLYIHKVLIEKNLALEA